MKYLSVKEQLREERKKNEILAAENAKLNGNVEYVAMMCNVEIPTREVSENE